MTKDDIAVEVLLPTGLMRAYCMVNGHFTSKGYIGYTTDEVREMFFAEITA